MTKPGEKRSTAVNYFILAQLPCALILFFGFAFLLAIVPPFGAMMAHDVARGLTSDGKQGIAFTPWAQVTLNGHNLNRRTGERSVWLYKVTFEQLQRIEGGDVQTEIAAVRFQYGMGVPLALVYIAALIIVTRIWILRVRHWLFGGERLKGCRSRKRRGPAGREGEPPLD